MEIIDEGSTVISSSVKSTFPPISSSNPFKICTSEISGNPSIVTGESANMVAGINATALFFAPLIRTVPFNGYPPAILIFPFYTPFHVLLHILSSHYRNVKSTLYHKPILYFTQNITIYP